MKKKDLKSGMIVEFRRGGFAIVIKEDDPQKDFLLLYEENLDKILLNLFEENLRFCHFIMCSDNGGSDFDIIAVYEYKTYTGKSLLWGRSDTPEYTIEELTKKIGHNFKIKSQ